MEGEKDIILHVYALPVQQQQQQSANNNNGSSSSSSSGTSSFLSRVLPSIGMAPYHTSLEVAGYRYTFAANVGIVKTASHNEGVPTGATYQEAIPLGCCTCNRGDINGILKNLGDQYFHGTSYHLVYRNCNHFTETLAIALTLLDPNQCKTRRLDTYPAWVNRLANTSKIAIGHDDDIIPCDPLLEARKATGVDERISWDLSSSSKQDEKASSAKGSSSKNKRKSGKKQLTEKQKAMLAKIKGDSGQK